MSCLCDTLSLYIVLGCLMPAMEGDLAIVYAALPFLEPIIVTTIACSMIALHNHNLSWDVAAPLSSALGEPRLLAHSLSCGPCEHPAYYGTSSRFSSDGQRSRTPPPTHKVKLLAVLQMQMSTSALISALGVQRVSHILPQASSAHAFSAARNEHQ